MCPTFDKHFVFVFAATSYLDRKIQHNENRMFLFCLSIYFIECGEKNQYLSRVRSTSKNADIFTAKDEIYLVFAKKK